MGNRPAPDPAQGDYFLGAIRDFCPDLSPELSRGENGVARDIRAISGATISSDCTCFSVKKAIAIYEEVFKKSMLAKLQ